MDNMKFVSFINENVRESVVNIVEEDLNSIAIKNDYLNELSIWYNQTSSLEKQIIKKLLYRVYDCAAWKILSVLDNDKFFGGRFELIYVNELTGEKSSLIDPPYLDELHDLYEPLFKEKKK